MANVKTIPDDNFFADNLAARGPIAIFAEWLAIAKIADSAVADSVEMTLATVGGLSANSPRVRTVLLKSFDDGGFVFYTGAASCKAGALAENSRAAILFRWAKSQMQVSAEGNAAELSRGEVADYFHTRPRGSQIGAWASQQSSPLESFDDLLAAAKKFEERFHGGEIPPPPHWTGFRLPPLRMEFWKQGENRLHRRMEFVRESVRSAWQSRLLQP